MLPCTPVIEPDRSIGVPVPLYGIATPLLGFATGAAGATTVMLTCFTSEVPPAPLAV